MKKETPKFYDQGLRFSCKECGCCCKTHDDYAYVYLSDIDVGQICDYLKMERVDFLNQYCITDKNNFIHLKMKDKHCTFLQNNYCIIYPVRPRQCSTWPFWTENLKEREWLGPVSSCCPGIGCGRLYSKEEITKIAKERDDWYQIDF